MNCSQHDLKGYLLGELSEAERLLVEDHLASARIAERNRRDCA